MMNARGIARQLSRGSAEKRSRSARRNQELQHNNGMHPTANSGNVIRQLEGLLHCVRGG
jgi:hypothetical protein